MSNLIISESQYKRLFEAKEALNEDRESKNMKMARNVVRQYKPDADAMEIITAIRNQIPNTRLLDCKFLPGVTQMFMRHEITDDGSKLNATLDLIVKFHAEEYNQMLNNETAEEIINRFAGEVNADYENDVNAHNTLEWNENASYKIYRIESHKDAAWANKYTDWCITDRDPIEEPEPEYDEDGDEIEFDPDEYDGETCGDEAYNNYTHNGLGLFYFCIKDGFDKLPKEQGEGCPLDEYGLSMIATSVDENGRCQTITCRWNHANGGDDHIMTPMQLSKIIGRNYYQTFKPYTRQELLAKGKMIPSDALQMIAEGSEIKDVFKDIKESGEKGIYIVKLNDCYNYYNVAKNQYMLKEWVDMINPFIDGMAIINEWTLEINDYMKPDGSLLFNDGVRSRTLLPFNNGHAYVLYTGNKENNYQVSGYIIDKNGKALNQTPFDFRASNFEFISDNLVKLINKSSYRNETTIKLFRIDGTPVLNGFELTSMSDFNAGGLSEIQWKDESGEYTYNYGLLQKDGNLFMGKVFTSHPMREGGYLFLTDENDSGYICDPYGKPLTNIKFDKLWGLQNNGWTSAVEYEGKKNYFNVKTKKFASDTWFDDCNAWLSNTTVVKINGKANVMNGNGEYILNEWFDDIRHASYNSSNLILTQGGKENVLNDSGNMFDIWFDKIENPRHVFGLVGELNGRRYLLSVKDMTYREYSREEERRDWEDYEDERRERFRDDW